MVRNNLAFWIGKSTTNKIIKEIDCPMHRHLWFLKLSYIPKHFLGEEEILRTQPVFHYL